MNTFPVPSCRCLNCGDVIREIDGEDAPDAGDILICHRCGSVMKLGGNLGPEPLTEDEVNAMIADLDVMRRLAGMVRQVYFIKHASN